MEDFDLGGWGERKEKGDVTDRKGTTFKLTSTFDFRASSFDHTKERRCREVMDEHKQRSEPMGIFPARCITGAADEDKKQQEISAGFTILVRIRFLVSPDRDPQEG